MVMVRSRRKRDAGMTAVSEKPAAGDATAVGLRRADPRLVVGAIVVALVGGFFYLYSASNLWLVEGSMVGDGLLMYLYKNSLLVLSMKN